MSPEGAHLAVVAVWHPGEGVADSKTLEGLDAAVVDKLLGKGGHVVSTIRLGGDVEVRMCVLRVLGEKPDDEVVVVGGGLVVAIVDLGARRRVGETNTNWLLNEDHVGQLVPRVRVHLEGSAVRRRAERALLGQEATESRASGTTVGPENKRVLGRVVLGLDEPVKHHPVLVWSNGDVAAVLLEGRTSWEAGQVGNEIFQVA
mmetsp:Transcript_17834/g.42447  ORF Transcript_17834/g.42447 Transcript_17834/m.42447 type:complete len:202 (+) Transcript_17834:433-1038(+)